MPRIGVSEGFQTLMSSEAGECRVAPGMGLIDRAVIRLDFFGCDRHRRCAWC